MLVTVLGGWCSNGIAEHALANRDALLEDGEKLPMGSVLLVGRLGTRQRSNAWVFIEHRLWVSLTWLMVSIR